MSTAHKVSNFFLFRVVIPTIWFVGTVTAAYYLHNEILNLYSHLPLLTGNAILIWFLVGSAFLPLSLRFYQIGAVSLILGGTAFNVIVGQIELTAGIVIWGGAFIISLLGIWLGGFGTIWWKFAQGRFAGDIEDVDT